MSAPVIYQLKHPLTLTLRGPDGERQETRTELQLRRPRAKDMRVLDSASGDVGAAIAMTAQLSGLSILEADELDAEDLQSLQEIIDGFLGSGPKTGKTSSAT